MGKGAMGNTASSGAQPGGKKKIFPFKKDRSKSGAQQGRSAPQASGTTDKKPEHDHVDKKDVQKAPVPAAEPPKPAPVVEAVTPAGDATNVNTMASDMSKQASAPSGDGSAGAAGAASPTITTVTADDGTSSASPSVPSGPRQLGLKHIDFLNVHRKNYTGRIELLQGSVEALAPQDETDLLIVYLRERGAHKANRDSALAALNRSGVNLAQLEKESKPQPSYRRHYHCWLSRQLPKQNRLPGFEYKRLLVYEDPGEELTRDDNIVLDIMKCLTTVVGGDVQISSVLLPLSGALLSPSLRKHFVKAATEVCYAWMSMGLPLRNVRILLPETDISKDIVVFQEVKDKLLSKGAEGMFAPQAKYDVFFSYAKEDKDAAHEMMNYLQSKNPAVRIYDAEPRDISVRQRGVVHAPVMEAINQSRVFLSLLSDDYFHSVECTESFSLAYCRDFDSQGNFIIPLFWRSCDLTPLARRLVATEGVDCREASFDSAKVLLEEILSALAAPQPKEDEGEVKSIGSGNSGARVDEENQKINIAEKLMMMKEEGADVMNFEQSAPHEEEETVSQIFFDKAWRDQWSVDYRAVVFGPRIGAGGFGEVYKAKYKNEMIAVKTLQKVDDDDQQAVVAEFMVEMKLMSKLKHPNIVPFLGACVQQPNLAILLEFMPGGSLYRAIHRRRRNHLGPFPLLKTLWIAYGISKGMEYLHCQYPVIIHRDLKSPNILLGSNVHEVKLTDFGLSRLRVATYVNTGPGGTPEWMAPELLRQDPFDEMSDVFSFGVILWELVVCEKPWRDDHPMQIVFKVGSRGEKLQIPPGAQCPPELKSMISACFQDQPAKRPRFSDLTKQLEGMVQQVEASRKQTKPG
eukprot:CAMPEP_0184695860 /NCGR_PEP_ID=MMETSP0313-20130426/3354_1 /TAXON_ID=2792 /ORGANISM="Porphyridium aerugineum, Strain SAG 1380-2" /LENGTH=857 /DNA_ID=CAMNT_0027154387 /DNA_START=697 /DNA_END=3270 /DNA_ORIENTATION=+